MTSAINDYFLYALLGIYAIGFVRLFVRFSITYISQMMLVLYTED